MTAFASRPIRETRGPSAADAALRRHGAADAALRRNVAADAAPAGSLLRFALRADATLCGAIGLLVAMAADPLSRLSGLSPTAEWMSGAALTGYGALLFVLAGLSDVRRVGVGVLAGNVGFAIVVAVVLVAGWLPLTGLGVATTIAFTAVTLAFAVVQYLGVRRLSVSPS